MLELASTLKRALLMLVLCFFFCHCPLHAQSAPAPIASAEVSAGDSANYTDCPSDLTSLQAGQSAPTIACSESLVDPHEVSDMFGRRIAKTYIVVEVKIRNLSDSYEYVLHDVRLGYARCLDATPSRPAASNAPAAGAATGANGQGDTCQERAKPIAVTSREKNLVRGVAEKGQLLDARNVFIRGLESAGTIGGGLSTFGFATVGFKDALNMFQGPFTSAMKGFLPDFTVNQMSRLDDNGFTLQASVVPKNDAISRVVFLSQDVFLSPAERKSLRLGLMGKRRADEGPTLWDLQRNLTVEVAGTHVSEVNTNQPLLSKFEPKTGTANDANVSLTLLGTNLDRASKVLIGDDKSASTVIGTLQLVGTDPTWATTTISNLPKETGAYHIFLETPTGKEVDTNQVFTVTAQQASASAPAAAGH